MNQWGLTADVFHDMAEVGGIFAGEVRRAPSPDGDGLVRGVDIVLRVRVSGEGDTDDRKVSGVELAADDRGGIASRFELPVPADGPISYNGSLMRVQWWIDVVIDVKRRRDPCFDYPVLVVPKGGIEAYNGPHPLRGQG